MFTVDFVQGNFLSADLHADGYLRHSESYIELGGNPDDVYN